jgi:hypothetical protein
MGNTPQAPGTPAGGTPPAQPAPQGTPGQEGKLIAGKYKTVEEAEKALQEAEKKVTEATERAKRSEQFVNLFTGTPPPVVPDNTQIPVNQQQQANQQQVNTQQNVDNAVDLLSPQGQQAYEKKVAQNAANQAVQQVTTLYQQEKMKEAVKNTFYGQNPELKGYEPTVKYFADQVDAQYPNLPITEKFEKIATVTKDYLNNIRNQQGNVQQPNVPLEGAGGMNPNQSGAGGSAGSALSEDAQKSAEQTHKEYMAEKTKLHAKGQKPVE